MLPDLNKVRHPSWRVYRALQELPELEEKFGLRQGIDVYYPYSDLDDLTASLVHILAQDPDYDDSVFNIYPAYMLFSDTKLRQPLECMLLDGWSPIKVEEKTNIPAGVVSIYQDVFFDTSVIEHGVSGIRAYVARGTDGVDGGLKRIYLDRGIDYVLADTKAIAHDKHSIDGMMMTMMVQAFKLARQKSESDERDDQISAQNWAQLLKQYAQYFNNATKGKGNLSVEKLLIELQTESPPQGVDSLD
jgi:hypothetical protein